MSTSVGAIASVERTLPPMPSKLFAITAASCCAYGLPSCTATTVFAFSTVKTYLASEAPWSMSLAIVRPKPAYCGPRVGAVSDGAEQALQILVMPCCHRIGAAGVAADEQAPPNTIRICGLAASLVAAVWPPSALHWSSSTWNLIG